MKLYNLIDGKPLLVSDNLFTWQRWLDDNRELCLIGAEHFGNYTITTRFLGLDKTVWETTVLERSGRVLSIFILGPEVDRKAAEKQHTQLVLAMLRGFEEFWKPEVWKKQQ